MKRISCRASTVPVVSLPGNTLNQGLVVDWRPHSDSSVGTKEEPEPLAPLTASEEVKLKEYEGILERGLATFFEVGNALLRIREQRLYRTTHATFEQYCRERWNIGKTYAWRVIGAAERVNLLPPGNETLPRPSNEFQIRPFLKLAPEEFPGAWKRAVKMAKAGKVTPRVVQAVIQEIVPQEKRQPVSARRPQSKQKGKLPIGQIIVLLYEARRCIEKHQDEQAIEALERTERLLCGPE